MAGLWSRTCVDQTGTATEPPTDVYAGRTFGPLALEPGLQILYPIGPSGPSYSDPVSSLTRVPGGLFISLHGYSPAAGSQSIVAVVDDSGSVRWRRCLTDLTGWLSVLDTQRGVIDVEVTPSGATDTVWWAFDLLTGESQVETERPADDLAAAAMARYAQPDVEFDLADPPGATRLRRVDATGKVLWRRDDLYGNVGEGFRTGASQSNGTDQVTVVFACVGQPIDPNATFTEERCPYALVGVGTRDGRTRWQLDGFYMVSLVADGYAIITENPTNGASSQLLDVFTGQIVTDGISSAPNSFLEECCGGDDWNRVEADGAVAWTVALDVLDVWYPANLPGPGTMVDLLGPSTTPQVVARFTGMTDQPAGCSPALCWRFHAVGTGFPPDEPVTSSCWIDVGSGWTQQGSTITYTSASGGSVLVEPDCHIGQRAGQVKITINGIDSNVLTS